MTINNDELLLFDILKVGDKVRLKNKSISWHKKNNRKTHVSQMDKFIGKVGVISSKYDLRPYNVHVSIKFPNSKYQYNYSLNVIEPMFSIAFTTKLSKTINKIYLKEIGKKS